MSFNVKKIGSVSLIAASLFAASWGAQAATTEGAVVHITATVIGDTCTPSWSEEGVNVDLGSVAAVSMAKKGDVGATKAFSLKLTDCDASLKKVHVSASGEAGAENTLFKNTGDAKGVGVQILDASGSTTLATDGSNDAVYDITDGQADLGFQVKLVNDGTGEEGAASNGSVTSVATLNMTYE